MNYKKKSLLFIGGTGFLGQSFFDCIRDGKLKNLKLNKVIIVSRKRKIIKSKLNTKFIKSNIFSLKKLPITDYIIYAANSSNYSENIRGIKNFKKLLNDNHKKTKILFTSSGAVYGKSSTKIKFKESEKISIKKIHKLIGYKKNYALAKIFIENEFKELGKKGYKVIITRLFTFIGKRILLNKNYAITDLINQAKDPKKNKITLNSNKDVFRSYMNSEDLIRWIIAILKKANTKCEIYNVGSDETISISKLSILISKKYKKNVYSNINKSISKDLDYYVPSISKVKKKLGLNLRLKLNKSLKMLDNHF